jgi:uncharacterized protein (TIGR02246 family)
METSMPILRAVILLPIIIFLGACDSESTSLPVDVNADEQQIRQLTQDWFDAENRKDLDSIMGFVAERVVMEVPGMPIIEGKQAMRVFMTTFLESLVGITAGPMTIVVSNSGDVAYQFGTSTAVFAGPDGEFEDPEKYLFVWKKINGEWKAVAGAFSSDQTM